MPGGGALEIEVRNRFEVWVMTFGPLQRSASHLAFGLDISPPIRWVPPFFYPIGIPGKDAYSGMDARFYWGGMQQAW